MFKMTGGNSVEGGNSEYVANLDSKGNCVNQTCPLREICAPVLRAREIEQARATHIVNIVPDFINPK